MMDFQPDHEKMAALLDLMLATSKSVAPHALAARVLDWLMARDGVASGGVWLAQSGDLVCLARRNLGLEDVMPAIQQVLAATVPAPQTSIYQQDLRLTILPFGNT